jgi:pimeloyl-ACP methyl ester carboxylesterase
MATVTGMKKITSGIFLLLLLSSLRLKAGANNYSFGVRIIGKGKPMILIPGLKGSADTYNDVVAHYKDHYTCYVITLAGFAGQPASTELNHPLKGQRDEIIRYIIEKHLHKPVLVGFSFGGTLAIWIASTRPDLIGALVELDGVPFDAGIEKNHVNMDSIRRDSRSRNEKIIEAKADYWKHVDSLRHTKKFRDEGLVELRELVSDTSRLKQIMAWDDSSDYKASRLMINEMNSLDLRDSVSKISSPILVLGSWKGWVNFKTKEAVAARYQKEYSPADKVTIVFSENGKHFLMYDDFNWMVGEMDKFLKSI